MKAIVTGHTRGLGAAIAAELMQREVAVLGLARRRNETLAQQWPALLHQQVIDLADPGQLLSWLDGDALSAFLADEAEVLLINNAATIQPSGALPHQCAQDIAQAVMLNVGAALILSARLATLAQARLGCECRILHLSSGAGRQAYPGWSVYGASKAALDHHARAVAQDGTPGLRICSVAPGVIDTDMQAELRDLPEERFALRELFLCLHAQGQLAAPATCARHLMDFLLTEDFGQQPVASLG
ncbi:short chain dehydrogenase [Herbaspirillum rubrisubalbicans M1]|uniref:SDR family oxidoreductase n=1 Tax=Herbaspirillum rubrisubalbicans TaxID=80842 RepID=UPI00073A1DC8|nr:SDR family oxidoreductase [Herbaspirillum rubrisubalbicans]ALU89664.1 short chain dehydrogenase [Herbaspirillum rubrisubalbicans M1]